MQPISNIKRTVYRHIVPVVAIAVAAVTLSACSSTPASMRSQMQQWSANQSYPAAEQTISSDLSGIAAGFRLKDLNGLQTDCVGFFTDVDQIYGALPAPDATVTNDLNVAIETYWGPGSEACYNSKSLNARGLTTFRRDLKLGNAIYARAEKIIHGFGIS